MLLLQVYSILLWLLYHNLLPLPYLSLYHVLFPPLLLVLELHLAALQPLLDHLQVEKFKAVGYSTGAMTLIHMATQQPERITDLVLISASPYFTKELREACSREMDKKMDAFYDRISSLHQHGAEQTKRLRLQIYNSKDNYDDMNFTPPHL